MILVVAETLDGKVRKSALEAVYFGSKVGELLGVSCNALILGNCTDGGRLGDVWCERSLAGSGCRAGCI
jgi:hypothetical protein